MMLQAIGLLLPLAAAMAISSVPIMAALLILLSPNSSRSSIAYLTGWTLGIIVLALLFFAGAMAVPDRAEHRSNLAFGLAQIGIGVAMEVFALLMWKRSERSAIQELPKWLRAVAAVRPLQAFGFGFGLNLRPKALLLGAAVGIVLTSQGLHPGEFAIVLAVYTALCASTVAVPVVFSHLRPEQAQPRLKLIRDWIVQNNRLITILVMVLIGFVVIGHGLSQL